jgi:phage virion morphogenesis protein
MAKITVRLNDTLVLDRLRQLLDNLGDLRPAMREVAGVMADEAESSLEGQRAPDGTPWETLADSTIEERTKLGYWPGRILQRTGRLAASISSDFGPNFAVAGTNVEYAAAHQFGAKTKPTEIRPRNKKALAFGGRVGAKVNHPGSTIPARPFLGLSQDGEDEVLDILEAHLSAT